MDEGNSTIGFLWFLTRLGWLTIQTAGVAFLVILALRYRGE